MAFAEEQEREERLRGQHQQLANELSALPERDSRREDVSERLGRLVIEIRQIIYDESSDLCSVPECITRATVTGTKQWCQFHAPQQK
jgi:hypothetical protein